MTIKGNEIFFEFDPWELTKKKRPRTGFKAAEAEIADFVLEAVLDHVGGGKSPVAGGKWKRGLSPKYKKLKAEDSSSLFANMELSGDMLDSLEVVNVGSKLRLRIKGDDAAKADGHNNHSGKSSLPAREFIPKEGQSFKRQIVKDIRAIIEEFDDG